MEPAAVAPPHGTSLCDTISHKAFIKAFHKSQFPHKSVNLFLMLVTTEDKLADLWGN